MRRRDEESVSFPDTECTAETDKAILCKSAAFGEEWFPKSQVCDDSEVYELGGEGTLVITQWIAEQRGLA